MDCPGKEEQKTQNRRKEKEKKNRGGKDRESELHSALSPSSQLVEGACSLPGSLGHFQRGTAAQAQLPRQWPAGHQLSGDQVAGAGPRTLVGWVGEVV